MKGENQMAYRRRNTSRRGSGGYSRGRSTARRSTGRTYSTARRSAPRRSTGRRASGRSSGTQTVRIVLEGMPASPVARRNPFESVLGAPQVEGRGPRKAKL